MSKSNNLIMNKVRHVYICFASLHVKLWADMVLKIGFDYKLTILVP